MAPAPRAPRRPQQRTCTTRPRRALAGALCRSRAQRSRRLRRTTHAAPDTPRSSPYRSRGRSLAPEDARRRSVRPREA